MTILVGASGWLGKAIATRIHVTCLAASEVLTTKPADLKRIIEDHPVLINAAGSRRRELDELQKWNVDLVTALTVACGATGTFAVHLGSAAEYGLAQQADCWEETATPVPVSDYGRSKLRATEMVLEQRGCVLRPFNIFDREIQPGSPLADIYGRIALGISSGRGVEVMNANTTRDWVPRSFVADSVALAARLAPAGLFNLCSGVPITMGEIITTYLALSGAQVALVNLSSVPANTVVGCPRSWARTSGLTSVSQAEDVAEAMLEAGTPRPPVIEGAGQ